MPIERIKLNDLKVVISKIDSVIMKVTELGSLNVRTSGLTNVTKVSPGINNVKLDF